MFEMKWATKQLQNITELATYAELPYTYAPSNKYKLV